MCDNSCAGHDILEDFECLCCGHCCRGDGFVRVSREDIARMAEALHIHVSHFVALYTRDPEVSWHAKCGDRWLIDHAGDSLDCIFLEDNKCLLHDAKPRQCKEFPMVWRNQAMLDDCAGYQRLMRLKKERDGLS